MFFAGCVPGWLPAVVYLISVYVWHVVCALACNSYTKTIFSKMPKMPATFQEYFSRNTKRPWVSSRRQKRACYVVACLMYRVIRVGQNHIHMVYIRCFLQGNNQIYGHIQCIYTVLANTSRSALQLLLNTLRSAHTCIT
jgi:hypothetical protein